MRDSYSATPRPSASTRVRLTKFSSISFSLATSSSRSRRSASAEATLLRWCARISLSMSAIWPRAAASWPSSVRRRAVKASLSRATASRARSGVGPVPASGGGIQLLRRAASASRRARRICSASSCVCSTSTAVSTRASSSTISVSPSLTVCPSRTRICATVPPSRWVTVCRLASTLTSPGATTAPEIGASAAQPTKASNHTPIAHRPSRRQPRSSSRTGSGAGAAPSAGGAGSARTAMPFMRPEPRRRAPGWFRRSRYVRSRRRA